MPTTEEVVRARAVFDAAEKQAAAEYLRTGFVKPMTRQGFAHALHAYKSVVIDAPKMALLPHEVGLKHLLEIEADMPSALLERVASLE